MPASIDIRGIAVKLLKAHHLRYVAMQATPDPLTGTNVIVLKFRRDKEHSPKAFFDDLNENGIQYKKLVKDPAALEIVCELWPKGQKRQVSEAREKVRSEQRAKENGAGSGPSNGNMPYVGVPSGGSQSMVIQSVARQLEAAGHEEEARELLRIAAEQDWEEFQRKMKKVLARMRLHTRPEVRQLREAIATEIIKEMGPDVELLQGARGSDLEKQINDCILQNVDLVLDTRGIADSILRRTAESLPPETKLAKLKQLRRGFHSLHTRAEDDSNVQVLTASYIKGVDDDIQSTVEGKGPARTNWSDPVVALVSARLLDAAYLQLIESAYND